MERPRICRQLIWMMEIGPAFIWNLYKASPAMVLRDTCENWHFGWTWANKKLGNWIRTNLQCTKLGWVEIWPAFIWNLYKASPAMVLRDTCVKTDILVEPELTKNWETFIWNLNKAFWVGVYPLSASKAIFRARTYNCITYSVWWWWLLDEWNYPLLFAISGTGSFICPVA